MNTLDGRPPELTGSDDFAVINEYGHHFDGYAKFGGFEELVEATDHIMTMHAETGRWEGTIDELRGTLFFMLRQHRHNDFNGVEFALPDGTVGVVGDGLGDEEFEEFRSLYNAIRDRWGGVGRNQ